MHQKIIQSYREAFEGLPASVWLMSLVVMINRCGTMVMPFLALYATKELEFTEVDFGYLLSLFAIGGIFGSYLGGQLVRRMGSFPYLILALLVSGPMFFILGFLKDYYVLAFFLPLLAIATESARPATSTAVTELCSPSLHTKALTLLRTALNLGMAIGPVIGGAVYSYGFLWLVGINGCFNIGAAFLMYWYFGRNRKRISLQVENSAKSTVSSGIVSNAGSPFRDWIFMVATGLNIIAGIAFFQLMGIYNVFLRDHLGWEEFQIGLVLSVNTILIVVIEMLVVDRIKKFPPLVTIGIGNGLVLLGMGLTGFAYGHSPIASVVIVVGSIVVWTIGEIVSMPIMLAYASQKSVAESRSQYMGVIGMSFSIAMLLSPIIGTGLYDWNFMLPWYVMLAGSIPLTVAFVALSWFDETSLVVEHADEQDLAMKKAHDESLPAASEGSGMSPSKDSGVGEAVS